MGKAMIQRTEWRSALKHRRDVHAVPAHALRGNKAQIAWLFQLVVAFHDLSHWNMCDLFVTLRWNLPC
jgi:hypothetical protein